MDNKKFTNRIVDNLPLKKSKQYLWKYIQQKLDMKKAAGSVKPENPEIVEGSEFGSRIGNFFRSLLRMPQRLASAGAVAVLLVVALIFSNTLGGWFDGIVKIDTVHAAFDMVAVIEDGSGVATDSNFTLTASEDLSEKIISENLKVEPEVELDIKQLGDGKYEVNPVDSLESNKIYQFTIKSDSGEYSWAYQVQDTFKITGTLPGDKSSRVPVDTGIEINFSHENFDFKNFSNYFEISPATKGSFEQHRKIVAFIPAEPLSPGVIYTVNIKKGLPLKDSDKKLAEDYIFKFEVKSENDDIYEAQYLRFSQKYYEIGTKSAVGLNVYANNILQPEELKVQVFKYQDLNQYLEELKKSIQIPQWADYNQAINIHATSGLENLGNFEALMAEKNYSSYIYLPNDTFEAGYYLFQLEIDKKISQALVQITDLTNYINVSLTDTLVWVNDLGTGKAVENAVIELGDLGLSYKTGKDGVAKFETPAEWKKDYYARALTFVKISSPDGSKSLINQIRPYYDFYDHEGEFWQSFSTDRPRYKPTDQIQFFGFLKAKNNKTKVENIKLKLMKDWETFVKEITIEMDEDGTFIGELDLKSYSPGYYYLKLYQGENVISNASVEIADYVKPAFNLSVTSDKKAVFAGETMKFLAKANFFDGTPVPNLELDSYGAEKKLKTDSKGELKVSIKAKSESENCGNNFYYCSDIHNYYFDLNASLAEESQIYASQDVRIFDSHLNIDGESEVMEKDGKMIGQVKVKTNWIDLSRINKTDNENYDYNDYLGEAAQDRIIDGDITEVSWDKVETGQYYDFINKKVSKTYNYVRKEKMLEGFRLQSDAKGEINYEFEIEADKHYIISLYGPDDQGNMAHGFTSIYGYLSRSSEYDYYQIKILNGEVEEDSKIWWGESEHKFDFGEKVETSIANNEVALEKSTNGGFLFMQESEGIQDYAVMDSPYYSFEFSRDDVPNVYIEGVWFNGKEYQPAYARSVSYKKEIQKLDIEIESDKKKYEPGEEVKLSVKVTDADGKPAKAKVNLNLVDEAYYKIAYDNFVDPLSDIYQTNSPGILLSEYTHETPLGNPGNDGGKGGCFTGETQISMADGSSKAIKDVRKGDMILTKESEYSSRLLPAEVTGKMSKLVGEYLKINDGLEVTEEHIVFANGAWIKVADLKIGDSLLSQWGEEVKIFAIRRVVEPVWVYNIEVKGAHTYMADGLYVHNQKDGDYIRQDFKDTALFDVVETGADGRGEIRFKLPDNITSWRVMAKAIDTQNLRGGAKTSAIKVSMPFFVDMIMNREYSVKDKPMVKVRAYGEALKEGGGVVFKPELDGKIDDLAAVNGQAFEGSYLNLPKMEIGQHDLIMHALSGKLSDNLKKTFEVKGSRLKKDVVKNIRNVDEKTVFELEKEGMTEIKFSDGGVGYYYNQLWSLYYEWGERLDQKVPQLAARELMEKYFNEMNEDQGYGYEYIEEQNSAIIAGYQEDGALSLLPYSSNDLRLSALMLAFDSDPYRYDAMALKNYFYNIYKNPDSNLGEIVYSLLGLASLKEPVLISLREIVDEDKLTIEEKLYIALAFQNLGSNKEAGKIFEEVSEKLGKDDDYEAVQDTALGAVLAAGLNKPEEAEKFWKFVELKGFDEQEVTNIYLLGYVRNSLKHANFNPVKFKIVMGDYSEDVEIGLGSTKTFLTSPGEKISVKLVEGSLAAVLHYKEGVEAEDFKRDKRLSIDRKYFVDGREVSEFKEGDLVKVVINVKHEGKIDKTFFKITDILPSGLSSLTNYYGNYSPYESSISYPFEINGQEISFSWYPDDGKGSKANVQNPEIKYYARVVNPGEFYADPARIESFYDSSVANISEDAVIKIEPMRKQ